MYAFGELTPTERAARLGVDLARGEQLTTREAASRYGLTYNGAHKLLGRVSRSLPLVRTECGVWRLIMDDDYAE